MRQTFLLAVLALVLSIAGCSLLFGTKVTHFEEDRSYTNWLAETEDECDALNDQGINCLQFVEFFADGTAEIMLTDIVQLGTYSIKDDEITLKIDPNPETPGEIKFIMTQNGQVLIDDLTESEWVLQEF